MSPDARSDSSSRVGPTVHADHRADIDGLRAVAVLPVLLFHAEVPWCPGGSVGVDIFFVISGYLISRIILRDLALGRFSMVGFLERRARRILPALYLVMAASLVPAWYLMLADNLENFGQSLAATALSANNVLVWLTSGYWGIAAEFKPLLHTWSLGVEEQFYCIYPFMLLVLFPKRRVLLGALIVLCALSLGLSHWAFGTFPSANFLLLPFRAFELLVGGVLAYLELFSCRPNVRLSLVPPVVSDALCLVGLAAIALSYGFFSTSSEVPGLAAVLPVGGAALLIWFGRQDRGVGRLLATRIMVGIGAISYSLYLWHQPILAFYRLRCSEQPSCLEQLAVVCSSFPLAWLTWQFVETPFRTSKRVSRRMAFAFAIVGMATFVCIGVVLDKSAGFPQRVPGAVGDELADVGRLPRGQYVDRMFKYSDVEFSRGDRPKLLVLGNSYARDLLNSITECDALPGWEISYVPIRSKKNFSTLKQEGDWPAALRERVRQCDLLLIAQGDVPIFVTDDWHKDRAELGAMGASNILVIGTKNFGWNPNCIMSMDPDSAFRFRARVKSQALEWNQRDRQAFGSDFVDLLALLCDSERRVALFTDEGKLVSEDGSHLTRDGAKFIGRLLFDDPRWQAAVRSAAATATSRTSG